MGWINKGDESDGNSWGAGDGVCKFAAFFSNFALHLKGFLTAAITLDRFTAVVRPLNVCKAIQRAKRLSLAACIGSTTCSIIEVFAKPSSGITDISHKKLNSVQRSYFVSPQAIAYHLYGHTRPSWMKKCSFTETFSAREMQFVHVAAEKILSFGFPLATIMICYPCMFWKIWRISRGKSSCKATRITINNPEDEVFVLM